MTFISIPDIPEFLRTVSQCVGNVTYVDERGNAHDLKRIASQPGCALKLDQSGLIEVYVDNRHDLDHMIRFMMDMNYADYKL